VLVGAVYLSAENKQKNLPIRAALQPNEEKKNENQDQ
jgi:hypothetical protein